VGRQQELAELDKLVAGARLVTVTGMGGVGKSRLVARLATDILDRFPDGVWHVQLAPLVEGQLVANQVASSLGVGSGERHGLDPLDEIAERLRDRTTLVILDDCERVIRDTAAVARTILAASRQTRVLSTSRESMGMAGEVIYRLSPLPVPLERLDPATMWRLDSVRLFLERAEAAQPGFRLTSETADGVARICRGLEGLPLALELAAARLRMVNLEELSSRIDDEAGLLEPGRGSKTRQRTLLGVLDGSHEMLTGLEQKVFRRIGLFMGGFRVDLAVEVCQVGPESQLRDILFDLVDRSLLAVDPDTHRFHMLEFVRLYAERRLREAESIDAVEGLFAHRIASWLREAQASDGGDQQWLAAIEAEQENIRRALNWLIGRGLTETAMETCADMWRYWHLRGQPSEGRSWCERALAPADEVEAPLTHRVLLALGDLAALQGDLDAGIFHLEAALEVAHGLDDDEAVAGTLSTLAGLEHKRGNPDRATELFEKSLEISKRTGDSAQRIHVLASLALLTEDTGATTRADALGDEALRVARSFGDPYALADALLTAGELAVNRRDVDRAGSVLSEALEMAERTGLEEVRGWALTYLGQVSRLSADLDGALDLQRRGWAIFHEIDATAGRVWTLRQMALTEMDLDRFDEAAAHLRTALDLAHESVKADVPLILEAVVRLQVERGALEVAARTAGAVVRWRRDLGLRSPPTSNDPLEGEIDQVRDHLGDLWIVLTEEGATLELSDLAALI
ncbi:MAG: tetratricopeptide repeat protein, partial [Acidimicrobiia bacterium]